MDVPPTSATRDGPRPPEVEVTQRSVLPPHVRSRSETFPNANQTSHSPHRNSRVRAASTAELPDSRRRPVRPRLTSLVSTPSLAPAVLHIAEDETETLGSFVPTNSSGISLRSLLRPDTLPLSITRAPRHAYPDYTYDEVQVREVRGSSLRHSPPPSISPPIPSICRTPSSYTDSDYFPTAPSSAGPVTPAREFSPSPTFRQKPLPLHPVLESLEDQSRFCVKTACANCHTVGNNFPCCPRCGEMWCSRDCRLQSNGGKRHICRKY
ncbi:uncharacterized protein C8Q71DRAFT_337743 [Rhodofomes roseus]|uniref:MYND-type domain-containing protein n=1 Tax=Rhodofomes roseus TaxID=34475 RepID=A0ABQ8KU06_9APHY|nr:uncharacterized protein C8Q71DRAFT_337743 [Rhodofomes roseus]KAH9841556.1 hypothetical protein C8Q71DRAFT_337743 [Rhodofomes roseus]